MARDTVMRVRRADLRRWRDLAHKHRMPLDGLIDAALRAYDTDHDADAKLGRDVRALVATTAVIPDQAFGEPLLDAMINLGDPFPMPRRSRDPRPTEPLDFDPHAAASERHRNLKPDKES